MKYPASEHYSHLDPSEPIPEIEPRVNEYMRVGYEAISRYAIWVLLIMLCTQIVISMTIRSQVWKYGFSLGLSMLLLGTMIVWIVRAQQSAAGTRKRSAEDPWGVPIGLQIRYHLFFFLILWGLVGGLNFMSNGLLGGLFNLSWYVLMLGVALALVPRFARQPGQISCERCDYPLVGLKLPFECPECGKAIPDLSCATDRPRVRDGRILAIGLALVVFAGSIITLRFASPGAVYAPMPRAALLQLAPTDEHAFDQLMTTAITSEEERELFEAMIDKRIGFAGRGGYEQEDWVSSKIAQGWLTREELGALYTPATDVRIRAPDRVRVGESVRLLIEGDRIRLPRGVWLSYFFAGFRIGDDPTPHGRTDTTKYTFLLANPEDESYLRNGYIPMHDWTPTEPGEVVIRTRLLFAILPSMSMQSQIDWSAEGDARFPKPPLWTREVELEHTISVVE